MRGNSSFATPIFILPYFFCAQEFSFYLDSLLNHEVNINKSKGKNKTNKNKKKTNKDKETKTGNN